VRRLLAVAALGATLLAAAACTPKSSTAQPGSAATSAAASPSPSGKPTKEICDAVDPDKSKNFEAFTKQYGVMLGLRMAGGTKSQVAAAKEKAQEALRAVAADMRKAANDAADADLKAHLIESATAMEASAAKDAFFDKPKDEKEMEPILTAEVTGWLTPVMADCA
jgi:hypothetical protein